jgi:trigger factor
MGKIRNMKSKMTKLIGTARQVEVVIPKETVDAALEEILNSYVTQVTIPGFRKGKAPKDLVYKNYGAEAMEEVKKRLFPEAYQKALDKHEIVPVSYPEVSDIDPDKDGNIAFTAKVDTQPEVKIKKHKGIKVDSVKISVKPEEVDEAVARMQGMFAEFPELEGPIAKGDFGICEVEAFIDGKSISEKRENTWIEADKESSMLGMGEQICGMKKGEEKDIDITLPENYPDKKYAGKDAVFHIKVNDIREKKLPELNDEFAGKMKKDNMDQMKEELKAQLLERKEADNRVNMKNQVIDYLLNKNSFDVPASMVTRQKHVLLERAQEDLKNKGADETFIKENLDKLAENVQTEAEKKVRLYFMLAKIAADENVSVDENEIDDWLTNLAKQYSKELADVKKYYQENNLIGGIEEQLSEDKTLELLLEHAVITVK